MGCTILILVTGAGAFLRKRKKKTQTLHKILH
ncbi:MAG: LPXTG cell wall anchor domain-containing protein [Microcystis novacekii Mn_MB_F_20050700_S1]|uniref:LPXTG cell wall anchor domain-containing protein n=1 Tax=Microcystis novacekii Mn_MB_F_20050700_S1D TaxID=2486266 RepID=A0A552IQA3_9CHRO|nr:MAG: LPXTG cell wall anchor domain-containing protein [Microcystis novacekii Mn_MB_F_20050700_S1D]TRU91723.1 MAG: LPXTG cell wall anchor domain-containing protein [Microcystis novacekii Mn_MB_F_20050700_S1]